MNKKLSAIALSVMSAAAFAQDKAPEISFSGYLDADMAAVYDTANSKFGYQANQELDLTTNIKFSDKVSVDLFVTNLYGNIPMGGASHAGRWTPMAFDGLTLNLTTESGMTINVGDLVYAEGAFKYYGYRRTVAFGSVFKETYLRGVQVSAAGVTVGAGPMDSNDSTAALYVNYKYEQENGMSVKPFAMISHDFDAMDLASGVSAVVPVGDHSINATYGLLKAQDVGMTHTVLVEPTLAFGKVTVAATFFKAIYDETDFTGVSVPEDQFIYVEPGYTISDEFAVGLPIEYHAVDFDPNTDIEKLALVPTFYVYPAKGVEWWIYGGPNMYIGGDYDSQPIDFAFGSEVIARF